MGGDGEASLVISMEELKFRVFVLITLVNYIRRRGWN
jgi:hypothetical protein